MHWKKERDLLIAQTMAFVQSVAGKTAHNDGRTESSLETALPGEPLAVGPAAHSPVAVARPFDVLPVARLTPINQGDMRDEIRRRVAAFRDRQQLFDRDRDEYCNATMAKARAASELASKALDNQRLKR